MICEKDVENFDYVKEHPKEDAKFNLSDFCSKIIEINEKLIKSNIEINSKVDKLQMLLDSQEKKIKAKDEKLINLIISEIYSDKLHNKDKSTLTNSILKKFKSIME